MLAIGLAVTFLLLLLLLLFKVCFVRYKSQFEKIHHCSYFVENDPVILLYMCLEQVEPRHGIFINVGSSLSTVCWDENCSKSSAA